MTQLEYWRILAIQVAAAGPYKTVGRCFYCQGEDALASFQPVAFAPRVACCRRCREARTGVPDQRGLIHGTATVSRPLELPTPVVIRGLIPATCGESRPLLEGDPEAPEPQGILHGRDLVDGWASRPEYSALDVDAIFAPWGSNAGELGELVGDRSGIETEILALSDLDQQLDAMIAEIDRRRAEGLLGLSGSNNSATSADAPALTFDALLNLKAKYGQRSLRIIVGCPMFPPDRAFEWERRAVMFLGDGILDALKLCADLAGRGPQVHPFTLYGVRLEPWGSVDDHQTLALELARELEPS